MDVESLYINNKTERVLAAVRSCFRKYLDKGRPDEIIFRQLELSLTKNDFEFNGQYNLQIKGMAKGLEICNSLLQYLHC